MALILGNERKLEASNGMPICIPATAMGHEISRLLIFHDQVGKAVVHGREVATRLDF